MTARDELIYGSPVLATFLARWEAAASACARFEFGIRIQVGVAHPRESVRGNLSSLIPLTSCTEPEQARLTLCTRARNKLLHCELDKLLEVLQEADPTFTPPRLTKRVAIGDGKIGDALTSDPVDVQDTVSRDEGFFGWLLEAAQTGMFERTVELLDEGLSIANARHTAAQSPAP
ncbi:MAG: hypothetical protein ACE37F_13035 [Nannocystaceae bacterium]|nr:hypothetical protein [bacterium]